VSDLEALIRQARSRPSNKRSEVAAPPGYRALAARRGRARRASHVQRAPSVRQATSKRSRRSYTKYVATHAGERIEQIGKALGESTKELRLPMQKLIAERAVKTKGQKRATTYSAA
jgi:hypothetical protein